MTRTIARLSAALLTVALVSVTAPAFAHVGVSTTDAAQGGYGKAVFRVPNESDTAETTKIYLTPPATTPFAFASAGAKPGWDVKVAKAKLDKPTKVGDFDLTEAVRTVTWTATGDGIPIGQFDEFALSGGPFPEADEISFAVQQTYSDGEVVEWDQPQKGDEEPERPAPVLALAASTGDGHDSASTTDDTEPASASTVSEGDDGDGNVATWLAGAALVLAGAALVVSLRENRRRA